MLMLKKIYACKKRCSDKFSLAFFLQTYINLQRQTVNNQTTNKLIKMNILITQYNVCVCMCVTRLFLQVEGSPHNLFITVRKRRPRGAAHAVKSLR